jgi:outer membrane protein TolC
MSIFPDKCCVAAMRIFALMLLIAPALTSASEQLGLIEFVRLALRQSDQSYALLDSVATAGLDLAAAAHEFDVTWVPLARIGSFSGDGRQELGLEARAKTFSGTTISTGFVGSRTESDTLELSNSHSLRAYVKLSQGLFRRWGEKYSRANLTQAELRQTYQQLRSARGKQTLILNAVRRYYEAVLAQKLIDVSEQALKRSRKILASARARQTAGLVSKVDVYRAEVSTLNTQSALEDRRRALNNALEDLHEQIGLSGIKRFKIDSQINELAPVLTPDLENDALTLRPDWLAHQTQMDMSALSIYKAERDLLPDLSLNLVLEQKGLGDSIEEAGHLDQTDWSIQLEMRSTLDNFHEKNTLSRERIEAAKLRREGNSLKRSVQRDVRKAMQDLLADERRHRISLRKLEQARLALELAQIRYERGLGDNLDLVSAESSLADAELEILRTRVTYNIGAVELGYAVGVLNLQWLDLAQSAAGRETVAPSIDDSGSVSALAPAPL